MTSISPCISVPVRLYLNGAFYNGTALDSSALLVMGYERAQRAVVEMLSTEGRAGWEHDKEAYQKVVLKK